MKTRDSVEMLTVTNFGDDTDSMSLESAWFDFGHPLEDKTIVAVDIDTEKLTTNEQWTLFLRKDDDAAWTQVAAHTNEDFASYELATPITGKRFRYKLAYETKSLSTSPGAFRALKINALSGDVTQAWTVEIDATESLNLENEVIDPEDVYDDLMTLAADLDVVTFKRFKPNSDTEETYDARIARVELEEDSEGEFYARAVLVDKYTGAG